MALFKVAASSGTGTGTVLTDGTLVLASPNNNGDDIYVCRLKPGARKCTSTATLKASTGDSFYGTAEVLTTGGKDVSVVAEDCCNLDSGGSAVVFNSTNDGSTFGSEVSAGNISSVGAGTTVDGLLAVGTYQAGSFNVQAFPPNPSSRVTAYATPDGQNDGDTAMSAYADGLLVANDDTAGNTVVCYAPEGSNFNDSGDYNQIGVIHGETLSGISGNAILTDVGGSLTGNERLYFFNGTSIGSAHVVPEPSKADDGYFSLQDVGGVVHVFFLNRRHSYDIYQETTTNGVKWSAFTIYHTAITSTDLVPVLDSIGSGLLYESGTGSSKSLAQPILLPQSVHVSLEKSTITVGTSTKLHGTASPHLKGQLLTLERLSSGTWYNVSTTKESSTGTFSFTVAGKTETYRVVVAYDPGYYQYGYSNSVTLKAVPKK